MKNEDKKKNVVQQQAVNKQIKGEIYDSLRKALTKRTSSKSTKSWTDSFIETMLKEAKDNPSGPLGQLMAKQFLQDDIISKLDEQTDRMLERDIEFMEYRLMKQLYDKQREVFLDEKIRKKIVIGSRRIGKTVLATRLMVKECIKPNKKVLFVSLKFENAIRQAFDETVKMAEVCGLTIMKKSKNDGEITFNNGSMILFKGNHDKKAADGLQGYGCSLIIIDESQSQQNLQMLLEVLLKPTLVDFPDSKLVLLGTPPRIKGTYVEKIWNEFKGWKHYNWNMSSNPFLFQGDQTYEDLIRELCEERGCTEDAPFIQREYKGIMGAYDMEAQVFKGYTTYLVVPDDFVPTDISIGVDYGDADYNSLISLAYNRNTKQAYVILEKKFNRASVSEVIDACLEVYGHAKLFAGSRDSSFDMNHIGFYCDTNKQDITYELSSRYNLPAYNAYKYDKTFAMAQLADWCRRGLIQVQQNGILVDEFERTVYKRDEQDNLLAEIDDELFHPDATDALLYASRQYAYDTGSEGGGESTDKKQNGNRNDTLPSWLSDAMETDEEDEE